MASLAARFILCLTLGWILYDIILEINKAFGLSLNPLIGIVPAFCFYATYEYGMAKRKQKERGRNAELLTELKKHDHFIIIISFILVIVLAFVIFILWVGVLHKQISNEVNLYD